MASDHVLSLLSAGVPLRLLCDLAGVGPTSEELLREERSLAADRAELREAGRRAAAGLSGGERTVSA